MADPRVRSGQREEIRWTASRSLMTEDDVDMNFCGERVCRKMICVRKICGRMIRLWRICAKRICEWKICGKQRGMAGLYSAVLAVCLLAVSLTGCGGRGDMEDVSESLAGTGGRGSAADDSGSGGSAAGSFGTGGSEKEQSAYTFAGGSMVASEMFTERDLSGAYDAAEAEKITLSGGDVAITKEGVYLLSGTLSEGMVIVDAGKDDKIQLVLDGVEIDNDANAAIYVKEADKVFVTLADGSENSLISRGYTSINDDHIDGVIFAKSDLVINGTGSLIVNAAEGHGIVSRDDLKITGGSLAVTAQRQGLSGRDSVRVGGGTVQIASGKDGIHAENSEDAEKGYVFISDGTIRISSQGDGISAGSVVQVDGGTVDITAGGGSGSRTVADENEDAVSAKGIKAAAELAVNQGTLSIDSQDDAIHSNLGVVINGGELSLATGDDGIHADEMVTITGGSIHISDSYEGIEGNRVEISGGSIRLYAADDGINGAGEGDSDPCIAISGGVIYVRADGDGLDSNGDLLVSGGELYVSGPENGANGALDYEGIGQITGGTVVAAGNSGMAMNFGDTSTQGSILVTTKDHAAGTVITLRDSLGKEMISYTAECRFNSVVVSCPGLELGGTYTIVSGEERTEAVLGDSLIYGSGFNIGGFRNGGIPGGKPGGMPELPEGVTPGGEPPKMPEGSMPELPEGVTPGGEPPKMPEGSMPELPEGVAPGGEPPKMPEGSMPEYPDV